jgi:hypothetical protein
MLFGRVAKQEPLIGDKKTIAPKREKSVLVCRQLTLNHFFGRQIADATKLKY